MLTRDQPALVKSRLGESTQPCAGVLPVHRPAGFPCVFGLSAQPRSPGGPLLAPPSPFSQISPPSRQKGFPAPAATPSRAEPRTPPLETPPGLGALRRMLRTSGRFVLRVAGLLSLRLAGCGGASRCVRGCLRARARADRPGAAESYSPGEAAPHGRLARSRGGGSSANLRLPRASPSEGRGARARAERGACGRPWRRGPAAPSPLAPRPGEPHAAPALAAAAARPPGRPEQVQDRSGSTQRLSARAGCPESPESAPRAPAGARSGPSRALPGAQGAPCRRRRLRRHHRPRRRPPTRSVQRPGSVRLECRRAAGPPARPPRASASGAWRRGGLAAAPRSPRNFRADARPRRCRRRCACRPETGPWMKGSTSGC